MTYRRETGTWSAAMTAALKGAGEAWLAERLGVSPQRLRQCANPTTADSLPVALACEADLACASLGLGTPLFDEYRRRLADAGALRVPCAERRLSALSAAIKAAAVSLRAIADALLGAVDDEPRLAGAAA